MSLVLLIYNLHEYQPWKINYDKYKLAPYMNADLKTFRELKIGSIFKWYSAEGFKVRKLSERAYQEINSNSRAIHIKIDLDDKECYLINQPPDSRLINWLNKNVNR